MGAWHQLNLSIFKKVLSVGSGKLASELNDVVQAINDKEKEFELFSDEEIKVNFQDLSKKLNGDPQNIEVEAFAYIREAAKRTLGQRHYDVQLFGGLVLLRNKIAEMKTGEGKIVGFGRYNSEEDFLKTSSELKKMWDDFIKSFDGLVEWHSGEVVMQYKRDIKS